MAFIKYLFLDFDGVLHPQYDDTTTPADVVFCHLPLFESVMREFQEVQIVISSTWRLDFTLDNLRSRFSQDIAARIIGVTPDPCKNHPARRELEILTWLADTGNEGAEWVALDDAVWQFKQHVERVVSCKSYVGLDDAAIGKLRAFLSG